MTDLHLVPVDAVCQCGYAQSVHGPGKPAGACGKFKRSAFLTQARDDMAEVEKYSGTKPLKDQRRR